MKSADLKFSVSSPSKQINILMHEHKKSCQCGARSGSP